MTANTILLDFSIDPTMITNPVERKTLHQDVEIILQDFLLKVKRTQETELEDGFLTVFLGPRNSFVTLRVFAHGLVTLNIEYYKAEGEEPILTLESSSKLEAALGAKYIPSKTSTKPAIIRGCMYDMYFRTSDERILEYDVKKVLFDARSPYQKIQVFMTANCGNMLVLDDLQNLAESDLIYTETLMQRGKENYEGKEILILGGGDGALLWELLKEKPGFVTMIEIDEMVMEACRKYLRSCCGDCLDNYKGKNYEIIVDDCVKHMKQYAEKGKTFDYIFADLTDIPLSSTPQGETWDFIRLILELSQSILKPTGKYMTHGNGVSSVSSLTMYEDQLKALPAEFTKSEAFVPSFMELWIFYQVQKRRQEGH